MYFPFPANLIYSQKRMENVSSYSKVKEYVVKVDIVQKESIMNYSFGRKRNFVRIFMAIPKMVATLRSNISMFIMYSLY